MVLAHGPGLDSTGEIPELVGLHPKATVLGEGTATAEAVLREMDGAWLVHLAAHGSFRGDNPLFSALHLDDGDLTVHDLEQLKRAPYRLVFSACDVGLAASVGTDELLGVVGALLMLGSAGVVASLMPVPDGVVAEPVRGAARALPRGRDVSGGAVRRTCCPRRRPHRPRDRRFVPGLRRSLIEVASSGGFAAWSCRFEVRFGVVHRWRKPLRCLGKRVGQNCRRSPVGWGT